jgi:hypothetical protein
MTKTVWRPCPHYVYVCPTCGRRTEKMWVMDYNHVPTEAEKAARPGFDHIGDERLVCPCGETHTWYSLREIVECIVFQLFIG